MKNSSDNYLKIIEWSDEDSCYIGTSPGLFMGGIHGNDQQQLFQELCEVVEETIQLLETEGTPLPAATANKTYSGKISLRIPSELHRRISVRAAQAGESVNRFVQYKLEHAV